MEPGEVDTAVAGRLLALGSLVPGIVHELNNALLGLLGMIELAQADAPPEIAERLAIAQQAGDEIREIARVLGALAREPLEDQAEMPLEDLAREAVEVARTLNLVRGLELEEVYPPEPTLVAGSPAQLRQALLLLLGAGFAASGREGPLVIEVAAGDGTARVTIQHSGAGAVRADDPALAHVAAFATRHGGALALEHRRMVLSLPLEG